MKIEVKMPEVPSVEDCGSLVNKGWISSKQLVPKKMGDFFAVVDGVFKEDGLGVKAGEHYQYETVAYYNELAHRWQDRHRNMDWVDVLYWMPIPPVPKDEKPVTRDEQIAALEAELRRLKNGIQRTELTMIVDGGDMMDWGWTSQALVNQELHKRELHPFSWVEPKQP